MKRILMPFAVMALLFTTSCDLTNGPGENENDLTRLEGSWIRIASNNPSSDGIIITLTDTDGIIKDKAGSGFQNGDAKWADIESVDSENYIHQELGSDYNYYGGTMILRSDDTLRISVSSSGAGNEQKWVREGEYIPGGNTQEISGSISTETTLVNGPADVDYCVVGVLDVTAKLNIEPGTVIAFAENAGIGVYDNGALTAVGTSAEPIVLKGKSSVQGYWRGIHMETNTLDNQFDFVTISDAGSNYVYCCNETASLYLKDGKASIKNTTIANGGSFGIYAGSKVEFADFEKNTITTHQEAPMFIHLDRTNEIDGIGSDYSGNDEDFIRVFESTQGQETSMPANNVPYLFDGKVMDITEGLTIEAGVQIVIKENGGIGVYDDGYLSIDGTAASPVVIQGASEVKGFWRGIHIETNSINNKFSHVEISDAGSNYIYCCNTIATVFLKGGKLNMSNSTLSNGKGYGLYANGDADLTGYSENTVTTHDDYPLYMDAERFGELDGLNSSYTGNTEDYLGMFSSDISANTTWYPAGVPYLVEAVIDVKDPLTIEPGTEIAFTEQGGLGIYDQGSLNAEGTAVDNITFRGLQNTQGYWRGIHTETNSNSNVLRNVEISGAGSNYVYCCNEKANLFVKSGKMTVENSTISGSGGCGIVVRSAATLTESGNTFSLNLDGDICN